MTLDHALQGVLGFHDEIADFARGACSAGVGSDPVGVLSNAEVGVGHCDRQSDPSHDREIQEIIADMSYLVRRQRQFQAKLVERFQFVFAPLKDVANSEAFHAQSHRL